MEEDGEVYYKLIGDAAEFIDCFGYLNHLLYQGRRLALDAAEATYGKIVYPIDEIFANLERQDIICFLKASEEWPPRRIDDTLHAPRSLVVNVASLSLETINYLIDEGADISAADYRLVVWASLKRHYDIIILLLSSADARAILELHGGLLLVSAARHNRRDVIEMAAEVINITPFMSQMIFQSIAGGHNSLVMYLIDGRAHLITRAMASLAAYRDRAFILRGLLEAATFSQHDINLILRAAVSGKARAAMQVVFSLNDCLEVNSLIEATHANMDTWHLTSSLEDYKEQHKSSTLSQPAAPARTVKFLLTWA